MIPNTQNGLKYPLKIRHLQRQGVGGVEGVGHPVCMATIYMRARFAPQVQPNLQFGWSEYKDLSLGFAACLSKNPIIEFLF